MKKTIKRIALGIGAIVLIIILFAVGYGIIAKSIMKKMTPKETGLLFDNVISIKDSFTNMFLVKNGDSFIAIDCGNNLETIANELQKLEIDPGQVKAVLLTHTDGDHVAALPLFKNAKLFFSKQEEKLLNGKASRFLFWGNKISTNEYTLVNNGRTINYGKTKIKCILTPGHTIGSMCYLINDKYLFVGDALGLKNGKIEKFSSFFNVDSKTATQSMEIIANISEAKYIFTAHYGYTKIDNEIFQ